MRLSLHVSASSLVHLNAMTSVSASDGTTSVWTVGDDGFIAYTSQDGYITRIDSPVREQLYDVDFVSPDNGWIVGANALILHWNGTAWQVSQPPYDSRWPYSYDLYNVAFTEADDGWAAGCTGTEGGEQFLVYHWDGSIWSDVTVSEEGNLWACVHDMVALSSTDVWLVGTGWYDGNEYGVSAHWNGSEWQLNSELRAYSMYSLSALASDNIWAITRNGIVLHWNGVKWTEQGQLESANLIFARDVDDVFAVGTRIWHWNGTVWNDISSSGNFPADVEIKTILSPYNAELGEPIVWMLDTSGQIYSFSLPRTRHN